MATLKQRRQRFYILLFCLFIFSVWLFYPKQKTIINLTELYPVELTSREEVHNKIKVQISPYLSHQKDTLALVIKLESYEYPKVIHEDLSDIILVSSSDNEILKNSNWEEYSHNDYEIEGLLTYNVDQTIQDNLTVRLFLIDELTLKWEINSD